MKKHLHTLIWSIFFLKGYIEMFGIMPSIMNLLAIFLIVILFFESFFNKRMFFPYLIIYLLLIIVSFVSGPILNDIGLTEYFFFVRQLFLLFFLYLVVIVNERDDDIIKHILKLFVIYFAIQIPASWIKLIFIGGPEMEDYIGTMSLYQGSMTTLIAMIGSFFSFSKYLITKEKKYIIWIILFIIFSQIGGKRAVLFFIPFGCVLIATYYLYVKGLLNFNLKKILYSLFIFFIFTYLIIRINPTLNKEHKVWGSFDLAYTLGFVDYYQNAGTNLMDLKRINSLTYIFGYYMTSLPAEKILFGEGAGKLSESKLGVNPITYYYGIRYGARMGIVWIALQIGIIGTFLYLFLMYKILKFVLNFKDRILHKLIFIGLFITIMVDTLLYSMSSIQYFTMGGLFFTYFGFFYRDKYLGKNVLNE